MKNLKILFSFIFYVYLISCKNTEIDNTSSKKTYDVIDLFKSDTLIKIIPDEYKNELSFVMDMNRKWTTTLGLYLIENGSENFELRIWEDTERFKGKVILIKCINKEWTARIIKYKYEPTITTFPDSLSNQYERKIFPKSGWIKFWDNMIEMKIFDLPHYSTLKDYSRATDEELTKVEFAYKNYYKFYEYPDPYWHQDAFGEAKQMVKILKILTEEFSLN